ncbi:uncharacterized protein RCO7_01508 [Rhynchosporium graminicola]|uniref:Uncharacterized protein n=1 Tax=Rhynchosporium graminicola TaxID=2792576 RepID=A0A1E1JZV6_9HELO|nr:uncharacterized protein RCO7_01508 [Rhynchosporium commune]
MFKRIFPILVLIGYFSSGVDAKPVAQAQAVPETSSPSAVDSTSTTGSDSHETPIGYIEATRQELKYILLDMISDNNHLCKELSREQEEAGCKDTNPFIVTNWSGGMKSYTNPVEWDFRMSGIKKEIFDREVSKRERRGRLDCVELRKKKKEAGCREFFDRTQEKRIEEMLDGRDGTLLKIEEAMLEEKAMRDLVDL